MVRIYVHKIIRYLSVYQKWFFLVSVSSRNERSLHLKLRHVETFLLILFSVKSLILHVQDCCCFSQAWWVILFHSQIYFRVRYPSLIFFSFSSPVLFLTCCFSLLLTSQGTSGIHSMFPSFCTKKLFGSERDCFKSLFPITVRSVLGKVLRELGKNLSVAEFQQNMTIQLV